MKTCSICKQEKPLEAFPYKIKAKGYRDSRCQPCKIIKAKESYWKDKDRIDAGRQARLNRAREFVVEFLRKNPCVDCGNSDVRVLEFDHIEGEKINDVSSMIWKGFSVAKIEAEINKCEVRCANCHRIITAARGGWWRSGLDTPIDTVLDS